MIVAPALFSRSGASKIYLHDSYSYKLLLGNLHGIQAAGHERLVVLLGKAPLGVKQKTWAIWRASTLIQRFLFRVVKKMRS